MSSLNLLCQTCHEPLLTGGSSEIPVELSKALASGAPVVLAHAVCPRDAAKPEEGRAFEVAVSIREVLTDEADNGVDLPVPTTRVEELAAFRAGVRAENLDKAMRPLAEALGQEWIKVEKHTGIADPRA